MKYRVINRYLLAFASSLFSLALVIAYITYSIGGIERPISATSYTNNKETVQDALFYIASPFVLPYSKTTLIINDPYTVKYVHIVTNNGYRIPVEAKSKVSLIECKGPCNGVIVLLLSDAVIGKPILTFKAYTNHLKAAIAVIAALAITAFILAFMVAKLGRMHS